MAMIDADGLPRFFRRGNKQTACIMAICQRVWYPITKEANVRGGRHGKFRLRRVKGELGDIDIVLI
jgi:hypothetical protein